MPDLVLLLHLQVVCKAMLAALTPLCLVICVLSKMPLVCTYLGPTDEG
jgi:hypothetical protein